MSIGLDSSGYPQFNYQRVSNPTLATAILSELTYMQPRDNERLRVLRAKNERLRVLRAKIECPCGPAVAAGTWGGGLAILGGFAFGLPGALLGASFGGAIYCGADSEMANYRREISQILESQNQRVSFIVSLCQRNLQN